MKYLRTGGLSTSRLLFCLCLILIAVFSVFGIRFIGGLLAVVCFFLYPNPKPIKRRELDLEQFFSEGGYAWYWKINGKKEKCTSYKDFLKIKADYCELWLDGERFVFKDQG